MSRGRNEAEEARHALQMMLLPDLHKRLRFPEIPPEDHEGAPAAGPVPRGPRAMRVKDAAAEIGIGKSMMYMLIARGEIETIKIGRSTLVVTESLDAFLYRRRQKK